MGEGVGLNVGSGQISSSVAEQFEALPLHVVAPQHEYGVGAMQASHDEVSLRSAGPEQLKQSRDPVPAKDKSPGQRL